MNPVKINNKRAVTLRINSLLLSLIAITLSFILLFLLRVQHKLLITILCISFLYFLALLINTKFFEYENTGEVITIKYFSYIKKKKGDVSLEFPLNKINGHTIIKNHLLYSRLYIEIISANGKNILKSYTLQGMNNEKLKQIRQSLS